jgi:hypothetical protein
VLAAIEIATMCLNLERGQRATLALQGVDR